MMTCRGLHVIRDLYSVCPIMASNTMTTVSAGIPQEKWKISSVKKDLHIFTVIPGDCTALLIYNDEVAWVYLEFLEERGIDVPEDLSVVSFDDAELQDTTDIKLLSAIHPKNKLGRITGNHLLRMMDDENWQTKNYAYRFPAKLNDGNSVRKL